MLSVVNKIIVAAVKSDVIVAAFGACPSADRTPLQSVTPHACCCIQQRQTLKLCIS